MAKICVIGVWHQGAVLSACLADLGHDVVGLVDTAAEAASLRGGEPPVHEPGLPEIMARNLEAGRLTFTTDDDVAIGGATFAYVAIDTPVGPDDAPDLTSVLEAARRIGRSATGPLTVIVSAQVPVGTCELLLGLIADEGPPGVVDVAYVPEFLRLGTAVETFVDADRFVVGADDPEVAQRVAELFLPLDRPMLFTGLRSAEMGKHASNTFLAASISFINEVADLCTEVGADALEVAEIMRLDRRIGRHAFLSPGLGFAGGTLGRDIRALQGLGRAAELTTPMMDAVMAVNDGRAGLVAGRLERLFGSLEGRTVAILGLTYKEGTSTMRRAISLDIIDALVQAGAAVNAYDPLARLEGLSDLPPFERSADPYEAAEGTDAVVLVTPWEGVTTLDMARVARSMRRPVFIDTRNLFDPAEMAAAGLEYSGIGRGRA